MSPYSNLPQRAFWRTGVSEQHPLTVQGLYEKKFDIGPSDKIATAGSCFAQHIAKHMRRHGFNVLDLEPAPTGLREDVAQSFGYKLYSARYGNIYVVRQLLQLAREAFGQYEPKDAIWEKDGRFFDALRPNVEPDGLDSAEDVAAHRACHLKRVRLLLRSVDVFVFTFGLTESWIHKTGTVYPTAPATIAGTFDPAIHQFKNFTYPEIYRDFLDFRKLLKKLRPDVRFLITVSPVPLTATASGQHVLTATTHSKSVLRAVAGQLYAECPDVDYFPSYEMVASPFSRGAFYENSLRAVNPGGVEAVMRVFFDQHKPAQIAAPARAQEKETEPSAATDASEEVVCEEILLEAFSK